MEEPSRLLTTRFGTVAPSGNPKAKFHYSISHPNQNLDPLQKRMETQRTNEWAWLVGMSVGGGEHKHYSCWGVGALLYTHLYYTPGRGKIVPRNVI